MSDRVLTYECHVGDAAHDVPGPDVRILKTGDGGFIVACGCGPESVDDAEESPHPITDHLVNIYAEDPSPAQWLTLEGAADGWYDTTAWDSPEGFEGVNGQRRARFREQIREIADTNDRNERGGATERDRVARGVACPDCGAGAGAKCQRPSGHTVRKSHAERVEAAVEAGIIADDTGVRASRSRPSRPISAGGRSADAVAARGRADGSRHVRRDRRGDDRTRRRWVRRAGGVGDRSGRFVRLPREPHRGDGYRSVWRRDRRAARSCSE